MTISQYWLESFHADQENNSGGQQDVSNRCEVCPKTHGPGAGHLLCGRSGAHLWSSRRDEPQSVESAAWDILQALLLLHLLEPFQVCVCVCVTMVNQWVDPVFAYVLQSVADATPFNLNCWLDNVWIDNSGFSSVTFIFFEWKHILNQKQLNFMCSAESVHVAVQWYTD